MKKILTAVLLLTSALIGADDLYNSNILGMKLEQILAPEDASGDYYVRISEKNGIVYEHLFEKGHLFFARTIMINDGITITETEKIGEKEIVKRKDNLIISEEIKRDEQQPERFEYTYNSGRLESSVFYLSDLPIYREKYFYTKDGRILEVLRDFEDGRKANASFSFSGGKLYRYGFSTGDQNIYIIFDKHGIISSDTFGEGTQNETREYGTLDNGNRFELVKENTGGKNRLLVYNADKKIISSIIKDAEGKFLEESSWKYKGDLLSEIKIRKQEAVEIHLFEYDIHGELFRETYSENGNLVQVTEYLNEDEYTEKLYRFGKAVLEIKYKDGLRIQTEQLQE